MNTRWGKSQGWSHDDEVTAGYGDYSTAMNRMGCSDRSTTEDEMLQTVTGRTKGLEDNTIVA
jgi:hypothetical protein